MVVPFLLGKSGAKDLSCKESTLDFFTLSILKILRVFSFKVCCIYVKPSPPPCPKIILFYFVYQRSDKTKQNKMGGGGSITNSFLLVLQMQKKNLLMCMICHFFR